MLAEIEKEYERQLNSLRRRITSIEEELDRQKQTEENPPLSNEVSED